MPLNETDKAWIREEITKSTNSNGFAVWLRNWGPLLGFAALLLFAVNEWGNYKEFRGSTGGRLTGIENHLDKIDGEIRPLQAQVRLDPIISALHLAKVGAEPKTTRAEIQQIASKLSPIQNDFPDVPVVWQTTAEFINFKYDFMVPRDQEIYERAVSIDCSHGGETAFRGGILEFKNCALDLNQHIAGGSGLRGLSFVNCLIRYTGGSVPAVPMTLRDCIFRFDVPRIPPTSGKRMMQILAAEDTTTVQIPASSETPS